MMRRDCNNGRRGARGRQSGAAVVEFALVFPIFAAMLFGMIEYGWVFYQQFNLAGAVRDGLRQGVTFSQAATPDPRTQAITVTQADLQRVGVAPSDLSITATYSGSSPTKTMCVSATLRYRKLIGLVPTPAQLRYSMTMMLEQQ